MKAQHKKSVTLDLDGRDVEMLREALSWVLNIPTNSPPATMTVKETGHGSVLKELHDLLARS